MAPTVLGVYAGSISTNHIPSFEVPPWLLQREDLPCRVLDPDLFFPENYGMQHHVQIAQARDACFRCPMYSACLDWAVTKPDLEGVWAATTPPERRRLRNSA